MAKITSRYSCLQINAPEWYRREDFMRYLRGEDGQRPVATWHCGPTPDEYSDLFLWFNEDDEPEGDDLPVEVADELYRLCREAGFPCGVVWISNLGLD